jgi:uroporphyrinogen III methyltransferase / synthase
MTHTADTHVETSGAPLAGRSVIVTRTAEQSAGLTRVLEALGAHVIAWPVIAIADPPDLEPARSAIARLAEFDWVILTSANAVERFFTYVAQSSHPEGALTNLKLAAVGSATAQAMQLYGIKPHLVPDDFRAEGLLEELARRGVGAGSRILLPRALEAREILPDTLRERGATVEVVPVYRTVVGPPVAEAVEALEAGSIDAVTFTSPSTFTNFRALVGSSGMDADKVLRGLAIAVIGPVTGQAVRAAGHTVAIEPETYTVEGLVGGVVDYFVARQGA